MADVTVPAEVVTEITQILSNLVLGDNAIRSSAEKAVDERLAQTPELYLLAIAQFATAADTELMRSFSLVLLRRLLFRPTPPHRLSLYDHLSAPALTTLERILLHALAHEPVPIVRRKAVDTVTDLANQAMARGRPWHALQERTFGMASAEDALTREAAFRVFAGCPNLVMDLQADAVVGLLGKGLQDGQSVEVRLASLRAAVSYLNASDTAQHAQLLSLLYPMLNTLPSLPHAQLPQFLSVLTELATTNPLLFKPHLGALLKFLPALLLPAADAGPTPTVAQPHPTGFAFPPPEARSGEHERGEEDEVRKAALEFVTALSEARPAMVRGEPEWTSVIVRGALEGMGEIREDETDEWLEADPSEDPTDDTYPHTFEHALDRVACALGGQAVLPPAFQYIPGMLASHDWRLRHAALMAIAVIAEGTSKMMQQELGKIVDMVTPMFNDPHPRVRYAACQCVGQLCTDLEEVVQEQYHSQIFAVLIPALEAPEPRVASHAAAALINFCEGVERDTLIPYLDAIVERLLKLLNPSAAGSEKQPKRYVQEQVVTSLAMVADASEATFAKHYSVIMPLLLNVMQNANTAEYRKLRVKAMECAGLIAIAVGREVFRPDANTFVELLVRIQNSPMDPNDTMLSNFLISTWAKVCQAMGTEFEPYLPVVMPPLLRVAGSKADISIYDEDDESEEKEGWERVRLDTGHQVGVKTSVLEDKCQAFETLLIYASTLGPNFGPYLSQVLELALPGLRFYIHDGVQEACAMLIPALISCGKQSGTLTNQMVSATFSQLVNCISAESDSSLLASLYKCFTDTLAVLGGPAALPPEYAHGVVEASKRQLQGLADRRKARANDRRGDLEDLMLLEELEDFALEDMAKLVGLLDPNHPLIIAISSVKDLGLHLGDWGAEEGGGT